MIFTSYAQNFEDVMLWRALKHIPHGRYIDIGAQHPVVDSVSKGFYEQGWRGTHVEPVPHYAELLRQDRPDEVVLPVAISQQSGVIDLHQIPDTGLSTAVRSQAQEHQAKHGFRFETISVPTMTMREAFTFLEGKDVHWLKIDVEGFEEHVLRSWDSQALRPWIMLVEATAPMSQASTHGVWESLVLEAGYRFVYFDGLNRFYVAEEQAQLASAFDAPPNVFDDARLSGTSGVWCATLTTRLTAAEEGWRAQAAQTAAMQAQAEQAQKQFEQQRIQQEIALREQLDRARTEFEQERIHHAAVLREQLDLAQTQHRVVQAQWATFQAIQLRAQEEHLHAQGADARAARAEQETTQARARVSELEQEVRQAVAREQAILASTSWRLSAPIRWLGAPVARLRSAMREGRIQSGLRRRVKSQLLRIAPVLVRHPALGRMARICLRLTPGLRTRLSAALAPPQVGATPPPPLSADARQILLRLRARGWQGGDPV